MSGPSFRFGCDPLDYRCTQAHGDARGWQSDAKRRFLPEKSVP
jgi:hypothetical protein